MSATGYRARIREEIRRQELVRQCEIAGALRELVRAYESGEPARILEKQARLARVEAGHFRAANFTPEFKKSVLRLVSEVGVRKAARTARIKLPNIYRWMREAGIRTQRSFSKPRGRAIARKLAA